jgi:hypothetical protein
MELIALPWSLPLAVRAFELLLGFSLVLQSLEYLRIATLDRVSDWALLRQEIPTRPRAVRPLLDVLLTPRNHRVLMLLRLALALGLMSGGLGLAGAALLFGIALVLLLRWRGAFNGGSDFMTLVGLTGLLIAHLLGHFKGMDWGWRAGLWYVTLHALTSYFMSGWVKLMHPSWRSGRALPQFLDTGIYGPLPPRSAYRWPGLACAISWTFTVWEGLFPLALLDARLAALFCAVASVFHFLVFRFFGLNRFFWAWVSTYPAIVWCAGQPLL